MTGKNDPFRSLGIRSSTSPAWVANNRSRPPLRSVVRDSVRSYLAAPIRSVASASINSCITIRTDSRIKSTPSPVRNASSSSDTADWGRAIGADSFNGEYLAVHTEDHAGGPLRLGAAPSPPNPTTPRDAHRAEGRASANGHKLARDGNGPRNRRRLER